MAPLFPFVPIHDGVTAAQLRFEKPLLYMSLIMVACQSDLDRQSDIARLVRYEISQAALVRGEKSPALLQALLILISWNHIHIHLGGQLINYLQISSAILVELGIDKEAKHRSKTSAGAIGDLGRDSQVERARSLEERRGFLGLYWTNSITKSCLKDITPIPFSRYADQCCRILESTMEYFGDAYLVRLVHVQRKIDKIRDILYTEDSVYMSGMSIPLVMGVSSLEQELQTLEDSLPPAVGVAQLLYLSHQSVRLYLRKISLDDRLFHSLSCANDGNATRYSMFRTNLLSSCLATIDSLMSLVFALPTDLVLSLPYLHWGQIGHALLILTRLSEVRHEAWNATYVSSVLDPRAIYVRLADKIDEVMAAGGSKMPRQRLPAILGSMAARLRELSESPKMGLGISEDVGLVSDEDFINDIISNMLNIDHLY
ncbi:hypothetical protein K458DRAFT_292127 [Lentithecium fluviatile CBS 122367]|uniref:Transcription factor domain-containing protein n=1 Tax=Lentithecium fluviatile CBS 122367 TaxID=1168545 RepID=A0A6G1JF56_9PLEO|nr:hypothetical protein K458DRAFT_292127 [Lentithecium fluviatile CBS 122367]